MSLVSEKLSALSTFSFKPLVSPARQAERSTRSNPLLFLALF